MSSIQQHAIFLFMLLNHNVDFFWNENDNLFKFSLDHEIFT